MFKVDEEGHLLLQSFGSTVFDEKLPLAYPQAGDGWIFEPALSITHSDGNTSTNLKVQGWTSKDNLTRIDLKDDQYDLSVRLNFRTFPKSDVFECWLTVRNDENGSIVLESIASSFLTLAPGDWHLSQMHGNWADEANLCQEKLSYGTKVLDSKLGSRAQQFQLPWFMLSQGQANEDSGEVIGGSFAWSGSFRFAFEMLHDARLSVIAGVNPFGSRYHLSSGETFDTPKMVWAWSDAGTGDLTRKLHTYVRENIIRDGKSPRAILLNNWEATYFTFDEQKITSLLADAKALGMELFLLDDGWFGSKFPRDNDGQGLGDWMVDEKKLPNGIKALTDAAKKENIRFGLWFEPEMVNPKSELYEKHPDWLIQQPGRPFDLQRNQMVLDLTNPVVRDFSYNVLHKTLEANPGITYIKWDCNRYFTQPGSPYLSKSRQSNLQIDYVNALYSIMRQLQDEHPNVELMMCSGGGARSDYGAMRFAHEVWASDMTDPVRRIFIQWGYSFFLPAIATACHVTRWGERPLKFCFDVAMSGRLGMDVDLSKLDEKEIGIARNAIETYKQIRIVVQLGELYRLQSPYESTRSALMYTYGTKAVLFVYSIDKSDNSMLKLKGLDAKKSYLIRELNSSEVVAQPVKSSGEKLMQEGFAIPAMEAHSSYIFELTVSR